MPFSESKRTFLYTSSGASYFCLIFLRLVQEGVLLQVSLNKLYACNGTASWPVADVGGSDLYPGGRGHFEGGGCSAVREQLPDRVHEVGLDSPSRSDDDNE